MTDVNNPYFMIYKDSAGYWRWNLKARNHKILADSAESYNNKQDAMHGISLVMNANSVWDAATESWI